MQEIIDEFTEYIIKTRNYSAHTATAYVADIDDFLKFFAEFNGAIVSVRDMARADTICFRAWLANRQNRGLSFKSTARALSALRGFYKYRAKYHDPKNEAIG